MRLYLTSLELSDGLQLCSARSPHGHISFKALWRLVKLTASFNARMAPTFQPATVRKANTLHLIHFHTRAVSHLTAVAGIFSHHHLSVVSTCERHSCIKALNGSRTRWRDGTSKFPLRIKTYITAHLQSIKGSCAARGPYSLLQCTGVGDWIIYCASLLH